MSFNPPVGTHIKSDSVDVLWFAPFAGIRPHSELELGLISFLQSSGYQTLTVRCKGELDNWCTVMSSRDRGVEDFSEREKLAACTYCRRIQGNQDKDRGGDTLFLEDILTQEDRALAMEIVAELNQFNWRNFEYDGFPLGKYWSYEPAVEFKTGDVASSEDVWARFKEVSLGGALSLLAAQRLLKSIEPKLAVTYSFEYAANRSFLAPFQRAGIPTYSIFAGGPFGRNRNRFFRVCEANVLNMMIDDERYSNEISKPLSALEIDLVAQHLEQFSSGNTVFAYSSVYDPNSNNSVRKKLGLRDSSPVVLVIGSSPDEIEAAESAALLENSQSLAKDDQLLRHVISCASALPHVDFVYRVHPRLVADRRTARVSKNYELLVSMLSDLPFNVVANLPSDELSLYNLAGIVDSCMTVRSTAAIEMMAMGCPVIYVDPQQDPFRSEISSLSRKDIHARVTQSLKDGWSSTNSADAFRYIATTTIRMNAPTGLKVLLNSSKSGARERLLNHEALNPQLRQWIKRWLPQWAVSSLLKVRSRINRPQTLTLKPPVPMTVAHELGVNDSLHGKSLGHFLSIANLFLYWSNWEEHCPANENDENHVLELANSLRSQYGLSPLSK